MQGINRMSEVREFTKQEVIELIQMIKKLDIEYARFVYIRENARMPEWNLREAMKAAE